MHSILFATSVVSIRFCHNFLHSFPVVAFSIAQICCWTDFDASEISCSLVVKFCQVARHWDSMKFLFRLRNHFSWFFFYFFSVISKRNESNMAIFFTSVTTFHRASAVLVRRLNILWLYWKYTWQQTMLSRRATESMLAEAKNASLEMMKWSDDMKKVIWRDDGSEMRSECLFKVSNRVWIHTCNRDEAKEKEMRCFHPSEWEK